ncbi:Proteasome assembly chaperone 2 [Pseudozyma hubeiensis]|nr:Proteasome assembly chaperone 2 [Pseudozyma hubeiensis]
MTQTPFYTPIKPVTLDGTTLVIPAVSIGSVPQLAVDLLLNDSSLSLVKVGRIDPSFCFPFVGPSESADSNDITTALEVFSNGSLTVIQQRSPILKSTQPSYISALTSFLSSTHFTEILYLTSLDAAARTDDEFSTPLLSLFPPHSSSPTTPILAQLRAKFPAFNPPSPQKEVPHIPGSLLTRKLIQHIDASEVKDRFGALLYFAAEGDTRSDAHALATTILSLLPSSSPPTSLKDPPSWSALFGSPAAPSLYA